MAAATPMQSTLGSGRHRYSLLRIGLAAFELMIGASAVWGGVMLMSDGWNLPTEWLNHTPLTSWFLPGVALICVIGGTQLTAAILLLVSHPQARLMSSAAGVVLIGWIIAQLVLLRIVHPLMQPAILASGLAVTLLARRLRNADDN